jgi:alpha-beta hydrolase superfamily lysophospholipase
MPREPATLQEDASHVRSVVEQLIGEGEGKEIVVVAHSYGGTVATEALEGLVTKDGKGVKRLVLLSATVPRVGETQVTAMRSEAGSLPENFVSSIVPRPRLHSRSYVC